MTRESIQEMLPPGTDLATCEGECEVETGRNIGADHVISGEFIELGGQLNVSMRLYATGTGGLTASESGVAKGITALKGVMSQVASRLMRPLGHSRARSSRNIGADLPALQEVSGVPLSSSSGPALGNLADLDMEMLRRYEEANKAERAIDKSADEKATTWRVLASYAGVTPDLKSEAERRAAQAGRQPMPMEKKIPRSPWGLVGEREAGLDSATFSLEVRLRWLPPRNH